MPDIANMLFFFVTNVNMERTFSICHCILTDHRHRLKQENL